MMLGRAVLLLCILPGVAMASEPEQLEREGKWVADYDENACHLIAQFGTGDKAVYARFTRYQPGDSFNFDVISKRLRSPEARSDAKVDFGLGAAAQKQNVLRGQVGDRPAVYFRSLRLDGWEWSSEQDTAPAITPEQEKQVADVAVTVPGARPFRLNFGSLDKPMEALRTCMTNLVQSWGYDPAVDTALSRRVAPLESPAKWLRASDYPESALRGGHNGVVQFRVDVDPNGAIAGCHVLARTEPDDFADFTCKLVTRRGKFEPALDAAGRPTRSYFITRVQWQVGT